MVLGGTGFLGRHIVECLLRDGAAVVTGSFNFTKAAEEHNAENVLVLEDKALASRYAENWRRTRSTPCPMRVGDALSWSPVRMGQRSFEIRERGGPSVESRQGIDEHDLSVEPGKMIAKERTNHDRLIGLEPSLHHGPQRAPFGGTGAGERQRRERKGR